jgi:hypothetical protein
MKTIITASALLLVSTYTYSASFEDVLQNPDLGTGVYDKPTTLSEPTPASRDIAISIDSVNKGNPDHSTHSQSDENRSGSSKGFASSLDKMNEGNPDHV